MFLYLKRHLWKYRKIFIVLKKTLLIARIRSYKKRKETLSPQFKYYFLSDIGTFFFAPLRALLFISFTATRFAMHRNCISCSFARDTLGISAHSARKHLAEQWHVKNNFQAALTVEAAMVLPIFLFCMTAVLQYGNVMETAVRFGNALTETGKNMAVAAYTTKYGGDMSRAGEFAVGALSAVYAQNKVMSEAGDTSSVKNANMLFSSFMKENEMIDLVLTYQIRSPVSMVGLPGNFFLQRASIRAWTGRTIPGSDGDGADKGAEGDYVYVTATGSVYHEDTECTHLKLSIHAADIESLSTRRNNNGGIYHPCEKCGDHTGSTVYITNEGNRYHGSLSCSGLKRTVRQISREEAGSLRPCSKCGGH